jgi:molybdopterin adenylyltransferase
MGDMTRYARVLTGSDSVHSGSRADAAGPALVAALNDHDFEVVAHDVVPDGVNQVVTARLNCCSSFSVLTAAGPGFSPSDRTPEATRQVIEREAPGLAEAIRACNPLGRLSRGVAGTSGSCPIVNLPGSTAGALESLEAIIDVLPMLSNCCAAVVLIRSEAFALTTIV